MNEDVILRLRGLKTFFFTGPNTVRAVDDISLDISRGEVFGLAGESGCGKSVTALSIMRLLDSKARIVAGEIWFEGQNLAGLPESGMRALRGDRIAMIFQDPMTSLNPVFTVGHQIAETIVRHRHVPWQTANREAMDLIERVSIPDPARRFRAYPHQLSGGMRQRIMIAMAIALHPALLIADEPTTALDVTVQQQILLLLKKLCSDLGMAVLLITHNLAVAAETCNRMAIMYAGQLVEMASTADILTRPLHPYTQGLLGSMPTGHIAQHRLVPIAGRPPIMLRELPGCHFGARCGRAIGRCQAEPQEFEELEPGHWVRCDVVRDGVAVQVS